MDGVDGGLSIKVILSVQGHMISKWQSPAHFVLELELLAAGITGLR
jgi:hypothetical protein